MRIEEPIVLVCVVHINIPRRHGERILCSCLPLDSAVDYALNVSHVHVLQKLHPYLVQSAQSMFGICVVYAQHAQFQRITRNTRMQHMYHMQYKNQVLTKMFFHVCFFHSN